MDNNTVFINEGFDYAITIYLRYKDRPYSVAFNSFLVVVIRLLTIIYGEQDITNTYLTGNVTGISGFDENLKRYGYSDDKLNKFKQDILNFYNWSKKQSEDADSSGGKSLEFVSIQKSLIDMMITKMKKANVPNEERQKFESLLYTPTNTNPSYKLINMQLASDPEDVKYYWLNEMFKREHTITFEVLKQNVLNPIVYEAMGLTLEEVMNMNQDGINNLNSQAFAKFQIDANEDGKFEKLNKRAEDFLSKKDPDPLTSGSGFVDGLLLTSVLGTLAAIGFILVIIIFR